MEKSQATFDLTKLQIYRLDEVRALTEWAGHGIMHMCILKVLYFVVV